MLFVGKLADLLPANVMVPIAYGLKALAVFGMYLIEDPHHWSFYVSTTGYLVMSQTCMIISYSYLQVHFKKDLRGIMTALMGTVESIFGTVLPLYYEWLFNMRGA